MRSNIQVVALVVAAFATYVVLAENRLRVDVDVNSNAVFSASGTVELATDEVAASFDDSREVVALTLAGIVAVVAAGGGVGGGGVLAPIFILIWKLDPTIAIPLSSIMIVGGALANLLVNIKKSRRNSSVSLIDWDFVLVMQPMLLMGSGFGMFLSNLLPTWLLCILLVLFLAYLGKRTLQKAMQARQYEQWGCCGDPQRVPLIGAAQRQIPKQAYSAEIPWRKVGFMFGLLAGVVILSLTIGSPQIPSIIGLEPNSFLYALASFLPTIFLFVFSHYAYKNIISTFYRQQNPRYVLSQDEIQWSPKLVQYFPLIALGAGTVSGMFSFGGGVVNAPLMLELGIEPSAAAAMTATTVLFSSLMSTFNYAMVEPLNVTLVELVLPIGFAATFLGHLAIERIVHRYNCPSLIIFSMTAIIVTSAIAMSAASLHYVFQ